MVGGLISDEEWAFFAPFVIEGGHRPRDHRLVLDGVWDVSLAALNESAQG